MSSLYDKEVKVENPMTDWTRADVKQSYMKTEKPKKGVQLCPGINDDNVCIPSLTIERNGEITPFYCWSSWYLTCDIFKKHYGGLIPIVGG